MASRVKSAPKAGAEDSEDDLATTVASAKGTENARNTTRMPKAKTAATRRTSAGKTATKREAAPKQLRQALKDRTNLQDGNETEEVDAFDDEDGAGNAIPKAKRAKTATTRKNATSRKTREPVEDAPAKSTTSAKRGRPAKAAPFVEPILVIPETQQDPEVMEDVEQSIEIDQDNMDVAQEPTPKPIQKFYQRAPSVPVQALQPLQPRLSARPGSAQPSAMRQRERSGSANGGDRRITDPELRRQLNDMTKKYDDLTLKYESLQDVGESQAESNFERLKKASDQKAKDANELIASLKKELAELRKSSSTVSSETTALQKQATTLIASSEKLTAERDDFKNKLQVSQNELKALDAKFMAARQQISNSVPEAKDTLLRKPNSGVSSNTNDAQKEAKMKENLYADLTGLIVRGVKRKEGEDEYDCIQTGRNGTLHFHLSIANDATTPHPKTPSGLNYEDAEFAYEPLLDESRDKELLDILPDYLTEEICFPRNHAQRFYSKVVDSMTKKIVIDED